MNDYLHKAITAKFGEYLVFTLRDVPGSTSKEMELIFTIPNLPPDLWKEYRQRGSLVRVEQEVYEQPNFLDEVITNLVENTVRDILKAPPITNTIRE